MLKSSTGCVGENGGGQKRRRRAQGESVYSQERLPVSWAGFVTAKKSARAAGQVETPTDEQATVRRRSFLTRGSQTDASDPEIFRPEKRIDFREQKPPPLALRESDGARVTGRE